MATSFFPEDFHAILSQSICLDFCRKTGTERHNIPGIRGFPRESAGGIPLATAAPMSPIACAIQNRFEEVCRAELSRLRRKTASLSDAHRAEVDAISVAVARAIAADIGRALGAETPQNVCNIIERLFHLTAGAGLAEVEGTVPAGVTVR